MLVVAAAAVGWSTIVAREQAVYFAEQSALGIANGLVAPQCTPGLRAGEPAAVEALDRVVRGRIRDGSVMRIKVWTASGRIIYSDQPALIGHSFELPASEVALIGTNRADTKISTLGRSENRYENPSRRLVEAYVAITDTTGEPLLFEAYFPTDRLDANARYIAQHLTPNALVTIIALQLLQLPLAIALARRLDHAHRERARLLEHAIAASDVERRRFARDLHDGVIQDLAGVGYSLGSIELQLASAPDPLRDTVRRISDTVRRDVRALRQTMLDIHPPDLTQVSLQTAINDLASPLRTAGMVCQIRVPDGSGLSGPTRQLLYRAARELLRNVEKHAHAGRVEVNVVLEPDSVTLSVQDDGVGFDPVNSEPMAGHLGMRLLREAVEDAGGRFVVTSAPGHGADIRVVLPTARGARGARAA
jgi:signal transduction histidine kinase